MPEFNASLMLSHELSCWEGTFATTAAFMVNEIITNDSEPIKVRLAGIEMVTDDNGHETEQDYADRTYTIVKVEGHTFITDSGEQIDLENVVTVEI